MALGQGGCEFLASMQSLQMLSLIRTHLKHEALAAVLGSLTTLTTLKLAWYTCLLRVVDLCGSIQRVSG